MFIVGLFTITTIWKQSKCPSINEWIKQLWGICTMQYYLAVKKKKKKKREENLTLCNSMDGPGEHYATWYKPVRERWMPYDFTHI